MPKGRRRVYKKTVRNQDWEIVWRDDGEWPKSGLIRPWDNAPCCGAKTRKGAPCFSIPSRGQARCRMHGGVSPAKFLAAHSPVTVPTGAQLRVQGTVQTDDPRVLDMKGTIASMLGLLDAARPLAIDDLDATAMIISLREAGLAMDDQFERKLMDSLQTVQFDRVIALVGAHAKVGSLQSNTIRLQSLAKVLLGVILPQMDDFTARVFAACHELVPVDQRDELHTRLTRIAAATATSMARDVEAATAKKR